MAGRTRSKEAARKAYSAVDRIEMPGAQVRRDIGWRGLKH